MLEIKDLHVKVEDNEIISGIDLSIPKGEVHVIMGPNGSGKSTLANVIAGKDGYTVEAKTFDFLGKPLLEQSIEARAQSGIFLSFQYPVEIAGVSNLYFLKAALNAKRRAQGLPEMDAMDFYEQVQKKMQALKMNEDFLSRAVNVGFSGGEKKRNEILQLSVLEPHLAILDETDSGLDIDALKVIADGVNALRSTERSFLLITHYQRLLDYIVPDVVHVMVNGKILETGGRELALMLEKEGYQRYLGDKTGQSRKQGAAQ